MKSYIFIFLLTTGLFLSGCLELGEFAAEPSEMELETGNDDSIMDELDSGAEQENEENVNDDQPTPEEYKESIMDEMDHEIIMEGGEEDESWDPNRDQDGDGLTNAEEEALGTKIQYKDSDTDGLTDFEEVTGYNYNGEFITTNPLLEDTDGDTLGDGYEKRIVKTHPLKPDTDSDGCDDGMEVARFVDGKIVEPSNPLSSSSHPENCGGCPALTVEPLGGTSEPTPGVQCQMNCHCWTTGATPEPQKYFCYGKTPVVKVCNVESNRCILHPVTETVTVDPLGDDRPFEKALGHACSSNCVVDKTDTEAPQCIPARTTTLPENHYSSQRFDCSGLHCVFVG